MHILHASFPVSFFFERFSVAVFTVITSQAVRIQAPNRVLATVI
jgi:hypothetical protein